MEIAWRYSIEQHKKKIVQWTENEQISNKAKSLSTRETKQNCYRQRQTGTDLEGAAQLGRGSVVSHNFWSPLHNPQPCLWYILSCSLFNSPTSSMVNIFCNTPWSTSHHSLPHRYHHPSIKSLFVHQLSSISTVASSLTSFTFQTSLILSKAEHFNNQNALIHLETMPSGLRPSFCLVANQFTLRNHSTKFPKF